ncbi:hypothetical protein D0S45_07195 [Marinifilum sp. JC120]|nr:hypothetical protein D0S45_07195 [Marinifilum sp. JC120]
MWPLPGVSEPDGREGTICGGAAKKIETHVCRYTLRSNLFLASCIWYLLCRLVKKRIFFRYLIDVIKN